MKEKKKEKIEGKVSLSSEVKTKELKKQNLLLHYNKVEDQENNIKEVDMVTEKEVDSKIKVQGREPEETTDKLRDPQDMTRQIQQKKINKMKVIKVGREFKYEELKEDKLMEEKEKGQGSKEEQRFKSTHSGDIIVEANVINKYKSKSRTCNLMKIASKVNRIEIRVEKIKI